MQTYNIKCINQQTNNFSKINLKRINIPAKSLIESLISKSVMIAPPPKKKYYPP